MQCPSPAAVQQMLQWCCMTKRCTGISMTTLLQRHGGQQEQTKQCIRGRRIPPARRGCMRAASTWGPLICAARAGVEATWAACSEGTCRTAASSSSSCLEAKDVTVQGSGPCISGRCPSTLTHTRSRSKGYSRLLKDILELKCGHSHVGKLYCAGQKATTMNTHYFTRRRAVHGCFGAVC